jgi:2-polyprenyl-6-methoxyphenol hydroxylase-like FAD-dependent oxidoreductase
VRRVNSAIRRQLVGDGVVFTGINTWRGVTRHKPILGGRSYLRIGSILTGKIVIYPIVDDVDGAGNQLINWTTEIKRDAAEMNDWNRPGDLADFIAVYESWRFDWLDVAALIRRSEHIFEYPMVDKDPLPRWTFGRVTLAGDAAHPMYPRGSNGAAQSVIDARTLADCLAQAGDRRDALQAVRGGAARGHGQGGAHQPRAPARLHQHQGRAADRRQAVRPARRLHHPGRAARAQRQL